MEKLLKVCRIPQGKGYVPGLNLKGEYLKAFGFEAGDYVSVEISDGRIVISKTTACTEITEAAGRYPALHKLIAEFDLVPGP